MKRCPRLRGENLCVDADCTCLNTNSREKSKPMNFQNTNATPPARVKSAKSRFEESQTCLAGQWTGQSICKRAA